MNKNLNALFILSILFTFLLLLGNNAYAPGGGGPPGPACSNQATCLTFASNHSSGNQSVRVQAGTSQNLNASLFNVWLNGIGPLNFTNSGITLAILFNASGQNTAIYNSTNVSLMPPITNQSFPPNNATSYVDLVLNQSATLNMVPVNLTVNGSLQYFPSPNSTMFTINYIAINTNVPNAVFMAFNSTSKQFISDGPGGADARGVYAQHCVGIVAAGACIGEVPQAPNNFFIINGVPMCQQSGGFPPGCNAVFINSTQTIYAFDFASSNTSVLTNVTPGTPLTLPLNITSAVSFMSAVALRSNNTGGPFDWTVNISSFDVFDYGTSNRLFSLQQGPGMNKGEAPLFLAKGRFYTININVSGYGVSNYSLMFPYSGFTGAEVIVSNPSLFNTTTIYGKVVNESNIPVQSAIVYIQMHGGSSGDNLMFFNSAMTDQNGVFNLTVPQTSWIACGAGPNQTAPPGCVQPYPEYQFLVMSNQTNASTGAPIYFQTTDNNNGKGYVAQSSTVYLPKPIVLKSGGQANVNVTLNGAGTVVSELAKFLTLGTGLARDAVTGKYTMLSIFNQVQLPSSVILPLFSPTGNVLIDILGKPTDMGGGMMGPSVNVTGICANTSVAITQGGITPVSCNLTSPGNLNITLRTYNNLFTDLNGSIDRNAGDFGFWFGTRGIIRDNATGSTVLYLSPEGMILPMITGFNSNSRNLLVPLPSGNYTLELAPGFEWSEYLGVANGTSFQIQPNGVVAYTAPLVRPWRINPRFNPSMTLSGNNIIEASVEYPGSNLSILDNASVSVSARVLYMNKSAVPGVPVTPLAFNSSKQRFVNTTFTPGALGVTAGKYLLMLSATNISGSANYTSISLVPMNAFDFQVGLDLGGFTFGTNQNVSGKIFAFNSTGPILNNTSPVTVEMVDQSGIPVSLAGLVSVSNISTGMGSLNITMPGKVGFYNIVTKVNSSTSMGMSDNWVQISNFNIQAATDKFGYQPNDMVVLSVKLSNASNGSAMPNATIEVTVDNKNTPAAGTTDSTGKATINLAPAIYGESSTSAWSFGWHNLRIKISIPTAAGDVVNAETWAGFNVRGMEAFIKPNRPSYSQQDTVLLDVFSPPGQAGTNVTAVNVDGSGFAYAINNTGPNYNQINLSGNWAPGHHDVEVKMSMGGSSGTQSFFTGFEVSTYSIFAMTNKFSYNLNESITLNVTVAYPQNGSAVSSTPVNAALYKAQPPNDILATTASGSTDSTGKVSLILNATQPGFNYIKINASNQLWFIGVQVSSINVQLQNSTGGAVPNNEYAGFADGNTSVTIVVNATTSGGSAVPDGSDVRATIWAFGRPQELPSAKTTNGTGNISFTIPPYAPAQVYGLEVRVVLPSGDTGYAPRATLRVSGGSSMQLSVSADRSFMQPYMAGDSAAFVAALTYTNGTAASGRLVKFSYGSERTKPNEAGNATTDANGVATLKINVPSSDGPYYLLARVDGTDIQSYSGFLVSSLKVILTPNASGYAPGDTMLLNITVTNRTSGAQINATGGFISIFNKNKGKRDSMINLTGGQPYQVPVSIPSESGAVGSYPIGAAIFSNDLQGAGFALVNVVNASTQISITVPSTITANASFTFNISAGAGTTAKVAVFSPAASSVVYSNDSVALSGTPNASITIAPDYAGVYIIRAFVDGVGTSTKVISVMPPASGAPVIWTHTTNSTSSSTSTAVFSTANDVYIMSNAGNATAAIMSVNTATNTTVSSSLPLKTPSGSGVYYGIFSKTGLTGGTAYFVRLDTDKASGVAKAMFTVQ